MNPAAQMIIKGSRLDTASKLVIGNGCTSIDLGASGVQQYLVKGNNSITIYNPIELINNNTNFDNGRGTTPLNCANIGSNTSIALETFDGKRSNTFQVYTPSLPDPIISNFSINDSQQFSLVARNYATITFKADCNGFFSTLLNNAFRSFPQGNASMCNAEQLYSNSKTNSTDFAPSIYNQSMVMFNDVSATYIGNNDYTNNSGTVNITVKACNTLGKCVQATAPVKIYARG